MVTAKLREQAAVLCSAIASNPLAPIDCEYAILGRDSDPVWAIVERACETIDPTWCWMGFKDHEAGYALACSMLRNGEVES